MKYYFLTIILFFLFIGIISPVNSQDLFTLRQAVDLAIENSFEIKIERNNAAISDNNNNPGVAGALPSVGLSASDNQQMTSIYQKLSNGTIIERQNAFGNNANASLSASMILYNGMRITAEKKRLEEISLLSKYQLKSKIQSVTAEVMLKYYEMVRQEKYLVSLQKSVGLAEKKLEIAHNRKEAGLAGNPEVFQSQVDLNTLLETQAEQELQLQQARITFAGLLNLPRDTVFKLEEPTPSILPFSLEEGMDFLKTNPDLKALGAAVRAQEEVVREIAALRSPTLRANAAYNYNFSQSQAGFQLMNQSYGPTIGLSLSLPLYSGGANKKAEQNARLTTDNFKLSQESLKNELQTSLQSWFATWESGKRQLALEKDNYKLSGELLELELEKYKLRESSVLQLRQAEENFENSAFRLFTIAYTVKTAEIQVKLLCNQLEVEE